MVYNKIAGQSVSRLAALSDGIFAVAMTLLVLDLKPPPNEAINDEASLWRAVVSLTPQLIMFGMSFLTLGIFWVGQQTQLNQLERSDRHLTWIHIAFLFSVSMMPFSTKLMAQFITFRVALGLYWLNILALGLVLLWAWRYASINGLTRPELPAGISHAITSRIVIAQSLYAVGAALCVVNTYVSIEFIVIVQLNYVLALGYRSARFVDSTGDP